MMYEFIISWLDFYAHFDDKIQKKKIKYQSLLSSPYNQESREKMGLTENTLAVHFVNSNLLLLNVHGFWLKKAIFHGMFYLLVESMESLLFIKLYTLIQLWFGRIIMSERICCKKCILDRSIPPDCLIHKRITVATLYNTLHMPRVGNFQIYTTLKTEITDPTKPPLQRNILWLFCLGK